MDEERREEQEVQQPEVLIGNTENTNYTTNTSYSQTTKNDTKGFGIAAMILGILSLIFCCLGKYAIILSILAIILGIIGLKKPGKGMAITGIVTATLGFILAILLLVVIVLTGIGIYGAALDAIDTTQLPDLTNILYSDSYFEEYDWNFEDYQ